MKVGRGTRKISTEQLVIEFFKGFSNNIEEIYIGKTKLLIILSRVSPKIADRILKNN